MVLTRAVFDQVGGFDPAMPAMQDWDLWLRVVRNEPIRVLSDIVVVYDDKPQGRISTDLSRRVAGLVRLLEKHRAHWGPSVVAFHESRLAATRFEGGNGSWWSIFQWRAPLASFWYMMQALKSKDD